MRIRGGLVAWCLIATPILAQSSPQAFQMATAPAPRGNGTQFTLPYPEEYQVFDPQGVRITWQNRRWQLVYGSQVIKDFGSSEQEARQALRLIQELRLTHRAVIGVSGSMLEYWLHDGQAPQTLRETGLRSVEIDPLALRVEELQGQWCLRDRNRILFNFGPRIQDAQQALGVMKKYQFDQVSFVGQALPSMYVFSRRGGQEQSLVHSQRNQMPVSRQLQNNRFSRLAKSSEGLPRIQRGNAQVPTQGLDGVATAILPTLGTPTVDRRSEQRGFRWQQQPKLGGTASINPESDRLTFDWRQASVIQDQGEWKLRVGTTVIANFGSSAHDARMALAALRHYRFNEQYRLGGSETYLSYFVTNGTTPRGVLLGLYAQELKPDQLELRQIETGYALCQGSKVVLRLRDREEDGRKLLETIKKNRCDRLCKLGGESGKEPVTLLLRSR